MASADYTVIDKLLIPVYASGYNNLMPANLIKVDAAGNILWTQNLGGSPSSQNIIVTTDGGFAYTIVESNVLTIHKLSSSGLNQWNRTAATSVDGSVLLTQTNDNGFAITIQNATQLTLLKLDAQSSNQWTAIIDTSDSSYAFRAFLQTEDGGYALVGSLGVSLRFTLGSQISRGSDFCLVKINSEGDLQWTKTYGGVYDDDAYSVVQTDDGGYVLVGNTQSFGAGETDAFMVKADASGNLLASKALV